MNSLKLLRESLNGEGLFLLVVEATAKDLEGRYFSTAIKQRVPCLGCISCSNSKKSGSNDSNPVKAGPPLSIFLSFSLIHKTARALITIVTTQTHINIALYSALLFSDLPP